MPDYYGQGALQGAGTGASIGTSIAPGYGTLIGAGVGAVGGLIYGGEQEKKAKKLAASTFIPEGAKENQDLARLQYNSTYYPGQGADEARNNKVVANSVGNLQRNAKSATDVLNSASNIQGGLGTNLANQIASRYQQWKSSALSRLMGANSQVAGFEDRNNQQYLAKKDALLGAGQQNILRSANDLLTAGGQAYDTYKRGGPNVSPFTYSDYQWSEGS